MQVFAGLTIVTVLLLMYAFFNTSFLAVLMYPGIHEPFQDKNTSLEFPPIYNSAKIWSYNIF